MTMRFMFGKLQVSLHVWKYKVMQVTTALMFLHTLCFLPIHLLWNMCFLQWSQRPWICMCYQILNLQLLILLILIFGCPKVVWTHLFWSLIIWMRFKPLSMLLWGYLKCMKQLAMPWFCSPNLWQKNWIYLLGDYFCERWGQQLENYGYNIVNYSL